MFRIQDDIRYRVIKDDFGLDFDSNHLEGLNLIAGSDISCVPGSKDLAYVSIAFLSFPSLKTIHVESQLVTLEYPYIPGYLAFREYSALSRVLSDVLGRRPELKPQVLLVDGNGQLHARGAGIASHFGVFSNLPTIGCAKSFFPVDGLSTAYVDTSIALALQAKRRSAAEEIPHEFLEGNSGKRYGAALLTGGKTTKNPIFVSVGHQVSLETALKIVKACAIHRVPEPIRIADKTSREQARLHAEKQS